MSLAPIVLFVYKRLWHTQQTVEALKLNNLASKSELFIFSDAEKNESAIIEVAKVREYIKTISGFKKITIIERNQNYGLAKSFIDGTSEILGCYPKMIGLEDDNVSSPYFLQFMNDALDMYEEDENVICISGYSFPTKNILPETFFLKGADTWSYATWKRGWELFENDADKLLKQIELKGLQRKFDYNGTYPFTKMLKNQVSGKIDSWGIRWYASAFVNNKFNLYPGKPLIKNIGLDNSGTHCDLSNYYDVILSDEPLVLKKADVTEDIYVMSQMEDFFRSMKQNIFKRLRTRIVKMLKNS